MGIFCNGKGNEMEKWTIVDSKVDLDTVKTIYESKEVKSEKNYLLICRNRVGHYSELYREYFDTYQEAVNELD